MPQRYEILEALDHAAQPKLWKAWDTKLQRYVVLRKVEEPSQAAGEAAMAEAAALCGLQHPHIVSVFNIDEQPGIGSVAVMEYLNGSDLNVAIQRGALTERDFLKVAKESLEGLVAAHKAGVIHKRLSPSSIMLAWLQDESFVVKLIDFAFGVEIKPHEGRLTDSELRRAAYLSPEQFLGHTVDGRSDLYSLGCSLYFMLTGVHPFSGGNLDILRQSHLRPLIRPISDFRDDVELKYADWVDWLMQRSPDDRPRDAGKALEVLREMERGNAHQIPDRNTGLQRMATAGVRVRPDTPATAAVPTFGAHGGAAAASSTRPSWLPYAIGGGVALLAGLGFLFTKDKPATAPADTGATNTPPVVSPALPAASNTATIGPVVTKDLIIWLTASAGVFTGDGSVPCGVGQEVAKWQDQQNDSSGSAEFKPVSPFSGFPVQAPVLASLKNQHGLFGEHAVLHFSGKQALRYVAPSNSRASGPLDDSNLTVVVVGRVEPDPKGIQQRFVSSTSERVNKAWDISWEKGTFHFGVRKPPDKTNRQFLKGGGDGGFHLLTLQRDIKADRLHASFIDAKGNRANSKNVINAKFDHGPLQMISVGANAVSRTEADLDLLRGDIAELLIYSRVLSADELKRLEAALLRKYFGR